MEICKKCSKKYMPHLMKPLTICDKCADSLFEEIEQSKYEVSAITESPNEGQKRYMAAWHYLVSNGEVHSSLAPNLEKALKIAAGINES